MFLSKVLQRSSALGAVFVAGLVLVVAAGPAAADPRKPFRLPPGAKGYQVVQAMQRYQQQADRTPQATAPARQAPSPEQAASPAVQAAAPAAPRVVTLRGPDGRLRTFVLQGSVQTGQPRQAVVRQGGR
jgi:hypothetical protein